MKSYYLKILSSTLIVGILLFNAALAGIQQPPKQPKSKYEDRADSLRKENMAPRRVDSVKKSQPDKMPVMKSDSTQDSKMPVMEPEPKQHMPVKELSDTLNKK